MIEAATAHILAVAPVAPPGSGKVTLVIGWVAWIVFAAVVVGLLGVGASMALSHRRGESGQHTANLGWVIGGGVLAAAASGIAGALLA